MGLDAGSRLGPYEVRGLLGAGGMGEVYRARDSRLGRDVAIKVLPGAAALDSDRLERFQREARAAGALNHPNILAVFDVGFEGGAPYVVSELLEGETLRERLRTGGLPLQKAIQCGSQIAQGLAAAHEKGIVHRDLKPENLFLTKDGRVKILDFGLAKLRDPGSLLGDAGSEGATASHSTGSGVILGTVGYMSPEQARGVPADPRSDIFSFGAVLYEMVARRRAFQAPTPAETLAEILKEDPPELTTAERPVPPGLERIVKRCLEKDPEHRFRSAHDLAFALEALSGTSPSLATAAVGTRRRAVLVIALLTASAVAIGTYLRSPRGAASAIDSLAVLPFAAPGADADTELLADGITESLINSLSRLPDLKLIARGSVFRYKGKEVDPREAARELGVRAVVTGRLARLGDRLQIGVELTDVREDRHLWGQQFTPRLADLLTVQQEISGQITEQLRQRLTWEQKSRVGKRPTDNLEAYRLYLLGRHYWYKFPRPEFQKSREYFQQAIDLDPSYALAHVGLADFYGFSAANGLLPPAETWPKVEAATRAVLQLDENLAEAQNSLASPKVFVHGDWRGAERHFQRAIELNPSYGQTSSLYGSLLLWQGRVEESLAILRKAQELDPLSSFSHRRLAHELYVLRRVDESIAEYHKALELDSGDLLAHEQLGDVYELAGRSSDAIKEWSTALTQAGNRELAALLERTYAQSGFDAAVKTLARARLEQLRSRARQGQYVPAMSFVHLHLRLGEREPAFEWLAKAEQERNRMLLEIGVAPVFDQVRTDPRFVDLVLRLGLPSPLPPSPAV